MEIKVRRMFGEEVHSARKKAQITLEEVSRKCQAGKSYICGIELCKVSPPRPRITKKLCDILGLDYRRMLALRALALAPDDLGLDDIRKALNSL